MTPLSDRSFVTWLIFLLAIAIERTTEMTILTHVAMRTWIWPWDFHIHNQRSAGLPEEQHLVIVVKSIWDFSGIAIFQHKRKLSLRRWYTSRMVEEVCPNLMSNELYCHFSRTVVTAQSISFNLSILNAEKFQNASTSQWAPAVWTEVRERPEVTRDYSRVAGRLTTSTFPVSFDCIVWQPVHLRRTGPTAWG